jgi:hypothetical protein
MTASEPQGAPPAAPLPILAPKPQPVFGVLALVFAAGALFFPRFLVGLPVLISIGCAVGALFRRERWPALPIVSIVAALGLLLLSSSQTGLSATPGNGAALDDVTLGRTIGGSLHQGQFLCFDEADALRGETLPGQDANAQAAQSEVQMELIKQGRCTSTNSNAGYDMTADGKERFTTPDGVIELWAAHSF